MPAPDTTPPTPLIHASPEDTADSEASILRDAEAVFAARRAALNPVAPHFPAAKSSQTPDDGDAKSSRPSDSSAAPAAAPTAKSSTTTHSASPLAAGVPGLDLLGTPALAPAKPEMASTEAGADTTPSAPASPDFSDIPAPGSIKPGSINAQKWSRLHEKADYYLQQSESLRREVDTLRAHLGKAGSASPAPEVEARLTALQQERDTLQAHLEAVAVERSPRVQAAFKPRIEAALAIAKSAVGTAKSAHIEELLQQPPSAFRDEQLSSILTELPPLQQGRLNQAINSLDLIEAERTALRNQSSEFYKRLQAEEQTAAQRRQAEQTAAITSTFEAEVANAARASELFRELPGNADHNGRVASRIETARNTFLGKNYSVQDIARAALWSAIGPEMVQEARAAKTRVAELEAELAKFRQVQPSAAGSGAGGESAQPADEVPEGVDYGTAIAMKLQKEGFRFRR